MIKLKVKSSEWSTGRPVAILNPYTAKKLGAHLDDRLVIKSGEFMIVATLDISSKLVTKNQVLVSTEIVEHLKLRDKKLVEIEVAQNPQVTESLNKKLHCSPLSKKEIYNIIKSIVDNSMTEIEIAFFISSIHHCGMSFEEIINLTESIYETGKKLKLKNKIIVDKHSIGGVAGNRTTPLVVSICASQGLVFPKTSSRAITSASGTADTMEAICRVNFSIKELKSILKKTNACLAWGGDLGFAPADDKIIQVEKIIHLDPEPNLLASIMAKKLAAGSNHILIDIPYGEFSKVSYSEAKDLKTKFEKLGKKFKLKIKCVLTLGSHPIGKGIGPVLELRDIFSVLNGQGPEDLRKKAIFLSGEIFELTKKAPKGKGKELAEKALSSGQALNKFLDIIKHQGANLKKLDHTLSLAKFKFDVLSNKQGKLTKIDNKRINLLARIAGSPKDKKAGVYLHKNVGSNIKKGEVILTLYSSSKRKLEDAKLFYKGNGIFFFK
jgi:AMP phosphorylase